MRIRISDAASANFAMQRPAVEERVEFHLFKAARSAQALLVPGGDVARRRLAFGFGLGALKNDQVSRHNGKWGGIRVDWGEGGYSTPEISRHQPKIPQARPRPDSTRKPNANRGIDHHCSAARARCAPGIRQCGGQRESPPNAPEESAAG